MSWVENIDFQYNCKDFFLTPHELSMGSLSLAMSNPTFSISENKGADQLCRTGQLICTFVYAIKIVQSRYFLNPKFKTSIHILWPYISVCVEPGWKPPQDRLSHEEHGFFVFDISSALSVWF